MSPATVPPIPKRAVRALTSLAVAAGLAATAAPAQAATWSYTGTDPKADGSGPAGIDLVGTTVTYDKATGVFIAKVETAAPFANAGGALQVFVGTTTDGVCDYNPEVEATRKPAFQFIYTGIPGLPIEPYTTYTGRSEENFAPQPAELKSSGNAMTMTTKADVTLVNLPLDCVYVATAYDNNGQGAIGDTMSGPLVDPTVTPPKPGTTPSGNTPSGNSPSGNTPSGNTPATRPPVKTVTADADADRDGTPDSRDACAAVPGAAKNGCPTVKPADEFRLGAKRVVVDRLVPLTGKACPARVRINVTSKGRKVGTGVFTVDQFGSFCRVNGIVRLKKRMSKVRVVAKGTGMGSTAKSVRR